MQTIDLELTPNQTFNIVLNDQNCEITVKEKDGNTYTTLLVDNTEIFSGILTRNALPIKPFDHFIFDGVLVFVDTIGTNDPSYLKYNTRYLLVYLTEEEYADLF